MLLAATTTAEVEQVVFKLKARKFPGPDGFTTNFFHFFWDIIQNEVWEVVEESRSTQKMLPYLNATFITLNPKDDRAT